MGERTWYRSRWTAPALVVWQVLVLRAGLSRLMLGIECATAWCRSKQAQRGTGYDRLGQEEGGQRGEREAAGAQGLEHRRVR